MTHAKVKLSNKRGRPNYKIPWKQVEEWVAKGASGNMVAAQLGIYEETLRYKCRKEQKMPWSEYKARHRSRGDLLLHVRQFDVATKCNNTTLLIWLGKQRLGQKEQPIVLEKFDGDLANLLEGVKKVKVYEYDEEEKGNFGPQPGG